jgi:hypothetical protein
MIEFAIATRFLVDFFWSEKVLSLIHVAVFAVILVLVIAKRGRLPRPALADLSLAVFVLFFVQSFARHPSFETAIELSKILACGFFYAFGRSVTSSGRYLRPLGWASFVSISLFAAAALFGLGYAEWGEVNTFAAGYYYKGDAALACLLCLTMVNVEFRSRILLAAALVMSAYVVFLTNARIFLPLVVAVPICCWYMRRASQRRRTMRPLLLLLGAGLGAGVLVLAALNALNQNMLGFDLANPYSAANTQGRNVIWAALIQAFLTSTPTEQWLGAGLGADLAATGAFSTEEHLAGMRAHSSLLYLLLTVGIAGALSFLWVLVHLVGSIRNAAAAADPSEKKWVALLASLALIFFVFSLTVEAVIRPQIMVPLFLVFGVGVRLATAQAVLRKRQGAGLQLARNSVPR